MQLTVTGADDLRRAAKQLRQVADGKAMRRDLVSALRKSAQPAAADVRAAAPHLPVKQPSKHHLRARIAAATAVQVRTGGREPGVYVRVSARSLGKLTPAARKMDRDSWRGWFDQIMRADTRQVRRGVQDVLNDIERRLGHR